MKKITRRNLLGMSAAAIVAGPLLALTSRGVFASDADRVDPAGAKAKQFSYVHQSEVAGKNCANCLLYSSGPDAEWGPCGIFPGKQVAGAGHCSAWVQRPG
jgi:hypothetical protein